jgi:hypothetical protein
MAGTVSVIRLEHRMGKGIADQELRIGVCRSAIADRISLAKTDTDSQEWVTQA